MKIYLYKNGHTLLADTDVVEEAEKILREYDKPGMSVLDNYGNVIELPLKSPLAEEINILWPMSGGSKEDY